MRAKGSKRPVTLIIGASATAEALRRNLVRRGIPHGGSAGHLRRLRRRLVVGWQERLVVCVDLDERSLDFHGETLRSLIADLHHFPGQVRCVGLLNDNGWLGAPDDQGTTRFPARAASLGCDVYAAGAEEALRVLGHVAASWALKRRRGWAHGASPRASRRWHAARRLARTPGTRVRWRGCGDPDTHA